MSRPPASLELNGRHVLALRAIRERRSPTDVPRRQAREGRQADAPLSAMSARAIRDEALGRLERAVLAGRAPRRLPYDLWPPADVRERALGLGNGPSAVRARRDLLRAWLARRNQLTGRRWTSGR